VPALKINEVTVMRGGKSGESARIWRIQVLFFNFLIWVYPRKSAQIRGE
jgi:hypothetical protein